MLKLLKSGMKEVTTNRYRNQDNYNIMNNGMPTIWITGWKEQIPGKTEAPETDFKNLNRFITNKKIEFV